MSETRQSFEIEGFRVEPSTNRLIRSETVVRLTHKTMKVLLCLVDHQPNVVRREALVAEVWDGAIVTEDVLNRAVADLRKAFGDRPTAPRFIETIPKTGYRLIARVTLAPLPQPQQKAPIESLSSFSSRRWLAAAVSMTALAIVLVAMRFSGTSASRVAWQAPRSVVPLTSFPGYEMQPRISPDGTRVAFIRQERDEDNIDIYVTGIDGEGLVQLTNDSRADFSPAWSPDGSRVAFIRRDDSADERCTLYSTPSLGGGPERRLASCGNNVAADLTWSPDGRWLAFSDRESSDVSFGIYLLSVETLERQLLIAPSGQHWGDRAPSFSPTSESLAFTRSTSMATQDLFTIHLDSKVVTRLTTDGRAIRGHSWSADGQSIVLASDRSGISGLWRVAANGGPPQWLAAAPAQSVQPTVSLATDDLVFVSKHSTIDIYRIDLDSRESAAKPFIESTHEDFQPRVDSSGERVAFVSRRSGHPEIWIHDQHQDLRLTSFGGPFTNAPRFSPDGQTIVFDARPNGHADVFVVEARGGSPRLLVGGPDNELEPSWSRSGEWVYFGANREGVWQIWKIAATGGEIIQVTSDGGYSAIESPSGEWLYFSRYDRAGLFRIPTSGGESEAVEGTSSWQGFGRVAVGHEGFVFVESNDAETWLSRLSFQSGIVTKLRPFDERSAFDLELSPDGRSLLYSVTIAGDADLMLAER